MMRYPHQESAPSAEELALLEERMKCGRPFTYGQLAASGLDKRGAADKAIQSWRRKGWISFERRGKATVWSLTDKGREHFHPSSLA